MRRFSICTVTIVCLCLAGKCLAGEGDESSTGAKTSWFGRMLPFKKKEAPRPNPEISANKKPAPVAPSAAALQAKEKADWLRRIAVCDKLKEIAELKNDDELRRKADQLDRRAWDMYLKRTASLPMGDTGVQADERILERRLGTSTRASQSLLPLGGRGNTSQAAIQGE
jgi:hypothetical protein